MLTLVSGPAVEPILLDEVKDYLKVDVDTEDALISSLIIAAREHLDGRDGMLGRALIRQTWDWNIDRFPPSSGVALKVPLPPLISVTSITYQSAGSPTEETWPSTSYTVFTAPTQGLIYPNYNLSWPSTLSIRNAVTIRIVAGYGGTWNDVPAPIRQAMIYLVGHWYDNRSSVAAVQMRDVPVTVAALLANYRIHGF